MIIQEFQLLTSIGVDSLSCASPLQDNSSNEVFSSLYSSIANFFNHPIFAIVGGVMFLVSVVAFIGRVSSMFLGVRPIIIRFAKALWRRKIAIIGNAEAQSDLAEIIAISKVFKSRNIEKINIQNIAALKSHSLILVDWSSCQAVIREIMVARANQNTVVIIYAAPMSIPQDVMQTLPNSPNTIIVNAKGRLMNDILISLLTSSFDGR